MPEEINHLQLSFEGEGLDSFDIISVILLSFCHTVDRCARE